MSHEKHVKNKINKSFTDYEKPEVVKLSKVRKQIRLQTRYGELRHTAPITIYRVSINSFPDYKHLLQENYVEYKQEHMLKCTNVL